MHYLLDTDAVIDYLRGIGSSVALLRDASSRGGTLCVCDVVIAEVHSGVVPADMKDADDFLGSCEYLHTTPAAARQAGRWRFDQARRGMSLGVADALVAAAAHAHGATLVTGNARHYPMEEVALLALPR